MSFSVMQEWTEFGEGLEVTLDVALDIQARVERFVKDKNEAKQ